MYHVWINIYVHVCTKYEYMYICIMNGYMYVCMSVYVCKYVCRYVCIYAGLYMYMCYAGIWIIRNSYEEDQKVAPLKGNALHYFSVRISVLNFAENSYTARRVWFQSDSEIYNIWHCINWRVICITRNYRWRLSNFGSEFSADIALVSYSERGRISKKETTLISTGAWRGW